MQTGSQKPCGADIPGEGRGVVVSGVYMQTVTVVPCGADIPGEGVFRVISSDVATVRVCSIYTSSSKAHAR
jgi:hypothetical protein